MVRTAETRGAHVSETVWHRAGDVLVRRTLRSLLLLRPGAHDTLRLEGAAAVVWDALARPATDTQLVDTFARLDASDPAAPLSDVRVVVVAARELLARHEVLVGSDG